VVLITKSAVLVAEPAGVVTLILPVVAPVGTVAVIWVAESTWKVVAFVVLKVTVVAPVKPVPVILTDVPIGPNVGVNDVIAGPGTVKLVRLDPVPPGVVTRIGPVEAPLGTGTVIWVALLTVNPGAVTPLNVTKVAPVKFVPVRVTDVPTAPDVGVNDVIVGQVVLVTVKFAGVSPVVSSDPLAFVTSTRPVVVPVFTTAVIEVPESILKEAAGVLLNSTAVTLGLLKLVPVMVTTHPTGPDVGENDVMVGATANAGTSRPSTSKATPVPTPATRRAKCCLKWVMSALSPFASTRFSAAVLRRQ
jgi:hypothetical protein